MTKLNIVTVHFSISIFLARKKVGWFSCFSATQIVHEMWQAAKQLTLSITFYRIYTHLRLRDFSPTGNSTTATARDCRKASSTFASLPAGVSVNRSVKRWLQRKWVGANTTHLYTCTYIVSIYISCDFSICSMNVHKQTRVYILKLWCCL